MSGPEGWHTVRIGDDVGFAVPPDAQAQDVQPLDSIFGMLRGDGYEVVYNYGRIGEDLSVLEEKPGYSRRNRTVDSRPGDDITFPGDGNPWGVVRLLHVQDGRNHLAVRVACIDDQTCLLAEDLFESIRFRS